MKNKLLYLVGILLISILAINCGGGGGGGGGGSDSGTAKVYMTDAPFPFENVVSAKVTVKRIEIRGDNENNKRTLFEGNREIELLNLRNGVTTLLGEVSLPAGTYHQIRLIVTKGKVVLDDGREFNLTVPSGSQSGLKINIKPALVISGGQTSNVILDFDVAKSFVVISNENSPNGIEGFKFKPVVRAANLGPAASIEGKVLSDKGTPMNALDDTALAGASVKVSKDEITVASTVTNEDGTYKILGLEPGSYKVTYSALGFNSKVVFPVVLETSEAEVVNISLSPNGETEISEMEVNVITQSAPPGQEVTVAEIIFANGAVTVEATNDISVDLVTIDGKLYVKATASNSEEGLIVISDSKGQTFSIEINPSDP